jgi:hypothetical protein
MKKQFKQATLVPLRDATTGELVHMIGCTLCMTAFPGEVWRELVRGPDGVCPVCKRPQTVIQEYEVIEAKSPSTP